MGNRASVASRVGCQRPRLSLIPADMDTAAGDEVIEFARRFGLVLDDWQQWVVRHMCAERKAGGWSANTAVLLVPRQSGKSVIVEAIEMAAMFLWDEQHVIYSAHLGKTATDHMRRIRRHIDANPSLRRAARVLTGKGDERVEINKTGAILEFITRGKKTARGGSPSRVIFDEAMYLTDEQIAAMLPSLSAHSMNEQNQAQMIYTSSAPLQESTVLHRLRQKALSGAAERMFFAEWSVDVDADPADRANWYAANPSLGARISEEWIVDNEFGVMSGVDFATERLGVPQGGEGAADGPISLQRWTADLTDGESMATDDTITLALDAPLDRRSACFAVHGRRVDRLRHVAIRHWVPGHQLGELSAVAKQLLDGHKLDRLYVPPKSPALAWRDDLARAGVEVEEIKPALFIEAQQTLEQSVAEGSVRHRGQPEMNVAVGGLAARVSGDSSPWSRRSSSVNVAPLFAAAAALAASTMPAPEFFVY